MNPDQEGAPASATPNLSSTGVQQEMTPSRFAHANQRLEDLYRYHVQAQTHLWGVIVQFKAPDGMLDMQDGKTPSPDSTPALDLDNVIGQPVIACYVCEVAYDPRLRRRRCPGDPAPHLAGGFPQ